MKVVFGKREIEVLNQRLSLSEDAMSECFFECQSEYDPNHEYTNDIVYTYDGDNYYFVTQIITDKFCTYKHPMVIPSRVVLDTVKDFPNEEYRRFAKWILEDAIDGNNFGYLADEEGGAWGLSVSRVWDFISDLEEKINVIDWGFDDE
tara:strand:+ start:1791 stop:2234 length:444 start_codon:yes stop_codon:yes gene_type:complete